MAYQLWLSFGPTGSDRCCTLLTMSVSNPPIAGRTGRIQIVGKKQLFANFKFGSYLYKGLFKKASLMKSLLLRNRKTLFNPFIKAAPPSNLELPSCNLVALSSSHSHSDHSRSLLGIPRESIQTRNEPRLGSVKELARTLHQLA